MPRNSFCRLLFAAMTVLALAAPGCGKSPSEQPADKAEAVVQEFLDSWTRGEAPDKFAGPNQSIQASDPDWQAGYRLLSFLSIEAKPGPEKPNHIRCRVALSLQDPKGKKVDKEVVYDVQMGDAIVVGRVSR
jgi:hypothetical protein